MHSSPKTIRELHATYNTDTTPPTTLIIVTPFLIHQWKEELSLHPDQELASYIVTGLTSGFPIGYQYNHSAPISVSSDTQQ